MSLAEERFAEDRATRDAARAVFDARMARVRDALGQRSVPQRLGDEAKDRAMTLAEDGVAVARDSQWVLAGTGLAICAWLLRRPLINSAQRLYRRVRREEPRSRWERLRDWTKTKLKA